MFVDIVAWWITIKLRCGRLLFDLHWKQIQVLKMQKKIEVFPRCTERCSKESLFFGKIQESGDGFFEDAVAVASLTGCNRCKLLCIALFDLCDLWGICLCRYILTCIVIMYVAAYEGYFFVNHSETLTAPVWFLFFQTASGPRTETEAIQVPSLKALTHHPSVGTFEVDDFRNFSQGYEMASLVDLIFFLIICLWSLWMFSTMVWANDPRSKLNF